jgi:hypothetical protein
MTPRRFSIEDSHLIIDHVKKTDNDRYVTWAVFDTSRTVEWRWIAVSTERFDIMLTFNDIDALLLWCAEQINDGNTVRCGQDCEEKSGGLAWLEEIAQNLGYESWEQYKREWLKVQS